MISIPDFYYVKYLVGNATLFFLQGKQRRVSLKVYEEMITSIKLLAIVFLLRCV